MSGMTHLDDFRAGFLAWLDSPIIGNGFDYEPAVQGYLSDYRLSNPGLSNSFAYILATGGLAYLLVHLFGFFGYFVKSNWKVRACGACLLVLWGVTVATRLPLTAFILAIGIERFCSVKLTEQKQDYAGRIEEIDAQANAAQ